MYTMIAAILAAIMSLTTAQVTISTTASTAPNPLGPCVGNGMCPTVGTVVYGCYSDNQCYMSSGACTGTGPCGNGGTCYNNLCLIVSTSATTTPVATTTPCLDRAAPGRPSDCPAMAAYCQNALYRTLMEQQCPRTCGYCTSNGTGVTASTCVDLTKPDGTSDCPSLTAYCNNPIYITLMQTQCRKSCGFC